MMKTILIAVFGLCVTLTSYSQVQFSVFAGPQYTSANYKVNNVKQNTTGKIGAPGRGYATFTGQGNGQGGREHGQKADQLPGQRSIMNPEHRAHICKIWGISEDELPQAGVSVVEMFDLMREVTGAEPVVWGPSMIGFGRQPYTTADGKEHEWFAVGLASQ